MRRQLIVTDRWSPSPDTVYSASSTVRVTLGLVEGRLRVVEEQRRVALERLELVRVERRDDTRQVERLEALEQVVHRVLRRLATDRRHTGRGDVRRPSRRRSSSAIV